eukprot:scaffold876_cov243-Pinguiococcus_pyrenoidosus.AAC.46
MLLLPPPLIPPVFHNTRLLSNPTRSFSSYYLRMLRYDRLAGVQMHLCEGPPGNSFRLPLCLCLRLARLVRRLLSGGVVSHCRLYLCLCPLDCSRILKHARCVHVSAVRRVGNEDDAVRGRQLLVAARALFPHVLAKIARIVERIGRIDDAKRMPRIHAAMHERHVGAVRRPIHVVGIRKVCPCAVVRVRRDAKRTLADGIAPVLAVRLAEGREWVTLLGRARLEEAKLVAGLPDPLPPRRALQTAVLAGEGAVLEVGHHVLLETA